MNRAELNSLCEAEGAYLARKDTGSVTPEMVQAFRAGHAAGYRDGLAVGRQTDGKSMPATPSESQKKANSEQADSVCPACGANWTVLAEMLAEKEAIICIPMIGFRKTFGSDNYDTARSMLVNCRTCREHFAPPKGA